MSKPLKTNTNISSKFAEAKLRESSRERSGLQKANSSSAAAGITKSKLAIKVMGSSSGTSSTTKTLKTLNKTETIKSKVDSRRGTSTTSNTPKANRTANKTATASKGASTSKSVPTKSRRNAPETPPSNRVTKTQFFPSKSMYSNALKEQVSTKTPSAIGNVAIKERNEIKITKKLLTDNSSSLEGSQLEDDLMERPRTATLKRGSIVNSNIAGPGIPVSETPSLTSLDLSYEQEPQTERDGNECDYEDDFDSYESDFEEYHSSETLSSSEDIPESAEETSSDDVSVHDNIQQKSLVGADEERMLDSGNFDMQEIKRKQLLDNLKESNELQNYNRSNMASLSDEGFEEGKSSLQGNAQCINFVDARKKWKQNKSLEKRRKRGEEILSMIRLDHYYFTLINMPPVPYDTFIRNYGKRNTVQVAIQTGDDDTSEEIQTDVIETANKWTQCPITFSKIDSTNPNYLDTYKKDFLGVGDDFTSQTTITSYYVNYKRLNKFISSAGRIVSAILDESSQNSSERVHQNKREIPFSSGYIRFDTNSNEILKNRCITYATSYFTTNVKILTVHGRNKEFHEDELSLKSIVCIWSASKLSEPEKMLSVTGELSLCSCIQEMKNLLFGGLCDGSITIWNMHEGNQIAVKEKLQTPSYTTEINCGHTCRIVAIQPLITSNALLHNNFDWDLHNNQICSLDDNGTLIFWSVIVKNNSNGKHLVPWNYILIVQNSKVSLKDLYPDLRNLLCTDMKTNLLESHHLFISTNYGCIVHHLTTGARSYPGRYNSGTRSQANFIEVSPFSPLYFFSGHEDGAIALFSRSLEKPLMLMSNKDDSRQSGIDLLQWSNHKPCIFYAKDRDNTIHVWDLAVSDMYPVYSVPFSENIICMKLSPKLLGNSGVSYMVLATENGTVYLHVLNPSYGSSTSEQYQLDVKKFLNYVNRL